MADNIKAIFCNNSSEVYFWNDESFAFIKHEEDCEEGEWGVYSSEGEKIVAVDSREIAMIVAEHYNFSPCSVH